MIDLEALDLEWRTRLTAEVPEIAHCAPSEDLPNDEAKLQATLRTLQTPAVFTQFTDMSSAGRVTHNLKAQVEEVTFVAGIVTRSLFSRAAVLQGQKGAYQLIQAVKKASTGWKPTLAQRPLRFVKVEAIGRVGDRFLHEVHFATTLYETYT